MRTLVSALLLATLVSGCAVQGKAVEAHFWDPCTELSDQALRAAGAKPETKSDAVQFSGWHMCGWRTNHDSYWLNVLSSDRRLADLRKQPNYANFRDVEVDGRVGQTYVLAADPLGGCSVAFDTRRGSIHVEMTQRKSGEAACQMAVEMAQKLLPNLPD